jgi:MAP3K TRAFs-binding domain
MSKPLCFVLMPFDVKPDQAGGPDINFDRIYGEAIRPGIEAAGMTPIRADEEQFGGIIHKTMFERLLYCDYAVADLTTANANVLYELGVRHAARPRTTLTVYARRRPLPFDVNLLRTFPYYLDEENALVGQAAEELRTGVADRLRELASLAHQSRLKDSPLFQLIEDWDPRLPAGKNADVNQERIRAAEAANEKLRSVRRRAKSEQTRTAAAEELTALRTELLSGDTDPGVLITLMLTYRALEDWTSMIEVYATLPEELSRQPVVRQQLAFAHNRRAEAAGDPVDSDRALDMLRDLTDRHGPTAETYGLIGRVYKARWKQALESGETLSAQTLLQKAVEAYAKGFETDWTDVYPGINAVTLLDVQGTDESLERKNRFLPVVRFAAQQGAAAADPGYWVVATLLELAVLDGDDEAANRYLGDAIVAADEMWQRKTTADNLRIIRDARRSRGELTEHLDRLIAALDPPPRSR